MRKVLSFVLVLSLVLGSFGMAFAAAPVGGFSDTNAEDVVVLADLGVISGYPGGTFKPANIVTRAEMAVIVIGALGLTDYIGGISGFKDMAGYAWAEGYVAYAKSLGIIDGYPDGTFKPGNTVTYQEAAKMLVAALGYTPDSLAGVWPANYVVKAQALGILDGISGGASGANRGDIATMTYQTMDNPIGKVDKDGKWDQNTGKGGGPDDMFTRLGATLNPAKVLDDTDAVKSNINLRPYIGAYAKYYENSKNKIIAVETESTFLTGELNAAQTEFESGDVKYSFKPGAWTTSDQFINKDWKANTAAPPAAGIYTLAVDVSGKTITEVYSYNEWKTVGAGNGNDAKIDNIAISKITASTPALLGSTFILDNNKEIDLTAFELVGVKSLSDIAKDNVVYVYSDGASKITKVAVGTEVVKGEITKRTSNDKITVGGKVYEFADGTLYNNEKAIAAAVNVGAIVELYLDFEGYVYDFKVTSKADPELYGVVLKKQDGVVATTGTLGTGTDLKIELYMADGTGKVFTIDEDDYDELLKNVNILTDTDGDKTAESTEALTWQVATGDVVKYALNSDGNLVAMEYVVGPTAGGAIGTEDLDKDGYFDGLEVDKDAVIITYKAGFSTSKSDYGLSNKAALLDSTLKNVWYEEEDGIVVFLYIDDSSVAITDVYGILTGAAKVATKDPMYEVTMLVGGVEKTYLVEKDELSTSKLSTWAAGAPTGLALYRLDFKADGTTLTKLTAVGIAGANTNSGYVAYLNDTTNDVIDVNGSVVTASDTDTRFIVNGVAGAAGAKLSLSKDVAVYVKDGTKYIAGDLSDVRGETNVVLVDTDGNKVYDTILVN